MFTMGGDVPVVECMDYCVIDALHREHVCDRCRLVWPITLCLFTAK